MKSMGIKKPRLAPLRSDWGFKPKLIAESLIFPDFIEKEKLIKLIIMSIYLFWGEDDFAMARAIASLRESSLDPNWESFNYDRITPDQSDALMQGMTQAMTPPFGSGFRFVWLVDTTVTQQCPPELLSQLDSTLSVVPDTTVLLFTTRNKPDGRLKSTKLLQDKATVKEFSLIPPWKTEDIEKQVAQVAQGLGVKLTSPAVQLLGEAVGNNTRLLYSELEKLQLYSGNTGKPISEDTIASLVRFNTQNSLQLAGAIRQGDSSKALGLLGELISHNEPGLKIVATLVGQFRTWLWVKVMTDARETDDKIAQAIELSNPKRVYFLKQEVKALRLEQLQQALPRLLELEGSLKRGAEETSTLQTKVIELCHLFR
jgi:DNA polymerase-3 subunit delta